MRAFDQVHDLFIDAGGDGDGDRGFEHGFGQALAAHGDAHFNLGGFLLQEDVGRVRHFQRKVFQVDALQIERGRVVAAFLLGVLVLISHECFRWWGGKSRGD
ncbi:hypothetical protein D3C78_1768410 [compost metagenome]